ncbi:large ribosomal subunit protein mL52-like [Glandiceps talaboti]
MAAPLRRIHQVFYLSRCIQLQRRHLVTSQVLCAGGKWRERQGLARNPTHDYGPLVDLPDWTYEDGRPAPPTERQIMNEQYRKDIAKKIDIYAKEMLAAKEKHAHNKQVTQEMEETIRKSRLRPKGSQWKTK